VKASEPGDRVLYRVMDYCTRKKILDRGDKILVAVSGGPDSTALLHILSLMKSHLDLRLSVAHINHGLRGEEARLDEEFVRRMSGRFGLSFHSEKLDIQSSRRKGESIEEWARRERRHFLLHIMDRTGCDSIATGHTLDDQAETVIFRIISGTGPTGFTGIKARSGPFIHPLLRIGRESILTFLKERNIPYRMDETNSDVSIPRNGIRHTVLPRLESLNRRYREHISNLSSIIEEENEILDNLAVKELETLILSRDALGYRIDRKKFLRVQTPLRRRIVLYMLKNLNPPGEDTYLPFEVLNSLSNINGEGNRELFSNSHLRVFCEYGVLRFEKRVVEEKGSGYLYFVRSIRKSLSIDEISGHIRFSLVKKPVFSGKKLYFDFDKVKLPLVVRSRRQGDRITLGNLGTKKIKDIFIDHKVPPSERERVPLVEYNGEIIGIFCSIYGEDNRVSRDYMVSADTVNVCVGELSCKQS